MMNNHQQQQLQRVGVGVKSMVYHGETCLGEAEVFPISNKNNSNIGNVNINRPPLSFRFPNNEIRISYLSPPSERCLPHSVLQTISPFSVRCKIQAKSSTDPSSPLHLLYLSCFQDLKTAVVVLGSEELHLVALPCKLDKCPCFWCFAVPVGLYSPCLGLLNLRCLAIVFDLDETLIVANTMKSFEDRIEALSNRIDAENDPLRVSGMSAELKRYLEDKALLKQYIETDTVSEVVNGRLLTVQNEEVPPLATGCTPIVRPVIRLQEKNIVLTRINPEIRDTSVLVRLRPSWEDLRSYLTAKGRKRFEVYVCTMAEKDYALEIWRLLDPEFHLISSNQLLDRIVCVKAGSKKSLGNVFQAGTCHPKMSMVMDDRKKVWDEKDQQRVHVVPPFQPYCAPQAETTNAVPVLCVARNVACNVRGAFFKEFDDNLLRSSYNLHYEDEVLDLPVPPDTSDYLVNEDTCIATNFNGNKEISNIEGITAVETEKRSNNSIPNGPPDGHVPVYILEEYQTHDQVNNSSLPDDEINTNHVHNNHNILSTGYGSKKLTLSIDVLHEIGRLSDSKIEFRFITGSSNHLQFSVEVIFSSEKIGFGIGRTKTEAQIQAADDALLFLANHYTEFMGQNDGLTTCDSDKLYSRKENGFLEEEEEEEGDHALDPFTKKEDLAGLTAAGSLPLDDSQRLASLISGIKELLCANEVRDLFFQDQPPSSMVLDKGKYYSHLETAGRILGKGICLSREGAKLQAAEDALKCLKKMPVDQRPQKRAHSPRFVLQNAPGKKLQDSGLD